MKIVYLPGYRYPESLDEPLTSGDLRYSFNLSRALTKLGHDVHVITRRAENDTQHSNLDGVHLHRYTGKLSKLFGTSFDISLNRAKLFKKHIQDADLIICNSPLSLEHMYKINVPIIYIASGLEDVKNYSFTPKEIFGFIAIKLLRDPMKRLTWKKSILINTTAWHEDTTLLRWGIPQSKIGTISSSIDTERYKPYVNKADTLRHSLSIDKETDIILSISRFTPAKGIIETVEAFSLLDRPQTKLLLIGVHHSHDTSYYPSVVTAINNSKRKQDIILLENIPELELATYYSLATLTSVFSKGYDPLPTTIIESMACGTPVISTYYETRKQFIEDNKTGLFVAEKNLEDWVAKITKILDNKHLRNKIASNALKHVQNNFDSVNIAKEYIRIINK